MSQPTSKPVPKAAPLHHGRPRRAPLWAVAVWLLAACTPGAPGADMTPADMSVVKDLTAGPSCGKIVLCIIGCGLDKLACIPQCGAGATPGEAMKAGALALCAATQCAGGDASTDLPSILGCLLTSCKTEVNGCDGLPF